MELSGWQEKFARSTAITREDFIGGKLAFRFELERCYISESFWQFCFFAKRSTLLLEKSKKISLLPLFFMEQHRKFLPFLLMLID